MSLSIVRGKLRSPRRVVVYGPPGVGKSTFACKAEAGGTPSPKVLALSWERGGLDHIGPSRVLGDQTWDGSLKQVREVCNDPGDWDTVVLDTADALEQIASREVCAKGKKESLSDFGYGDGFFTVATKWRELLALLEQAGSKGRSVHVVAHVTTAISKDPTLPKDYSKFVAALTKHSWGATHQWADAILFADYDRGMVDGRAIMTGGRSLYTVSGTGYDAKHRPNIASPIKLSWAAYERECKRLERDPKIILSAIRVLSAQAQVDKEKFEASLALAGEDVEKLIRIEIKLEEKLSGAGEKAT